MALLAVRAGLVIQPTGGLYTYGSISCQSGSRHTANRWSVHVVCACTHAVQCDTCNATAT